jgi:hypothetical protein
MATFSGEDMSKFAEKAPELVKKFMDNATEAANWALNPGTVTWTGSAGKDVSSIRKSTWDEYKFKWIVESEARFTSAVVVYGKFTWRPKTRERALDKKGGGIHYDDPMKWKQAEEMYKDLKMKQFRANSKYAKALKKVNDWRAAHPNQDMPSDPVKALDAEYTKKLNGKISAQKLKGGTTDYSAKVRKIQTKGIAKSGMVAFSAPYAVSYEVCKVDATEADARINAMKEALWDEFRAKVATLKRSLKDSLQNAETRLKQAKTDTEQSKQKQMAAETKATELKNKLAKLDVARAIGREKEQIEELQEEMKEEQEAAKSLREAVKSAEQNVRNAQAAKDDKQKKIEEADAHLEKIRQLQHSDSIKVLREAQKASSDIDALFAKEGFEDQKAALVSYKHYVETLESKQKYIDAKAKEIAAKYEPVRIMRNFTVDKADSYGEFSPKTAIGTDAFIDLSTRRISDETIALSFTAKTASNLPVTKLSWSRRVSGSVEFSSKGTANGKDGIGQFFNAHSEGGLM